jgi:hypothetical protein
MTSRITLLTAISLLIFACKKPAPTQVKIYSSSGIETLNGHVKEIYSSSSYSKHNFSRLTFDNKGQMSTLTISWLNVVTTDDKTDSTVKEENTVYKYHYEDDKATSIICELGSAGSNFSSTLKIDALGRLMNNKGDTTAESYDVNSYKYDKKNNLTEYANYESGIKVEPTIFRFKYDNQGRVIEESLCPSNGGIYQRRTYEFKATDPKGNWIKAIVRFKNYMTSEADSRTDTISRKISYY